VTFSSLMMVQIYTFQCTTSNFATLFLASRLGNQALSHRTFLFYSFFFVQFPIVYVKLCGGRGGGAIVWGGIPQGRSWVPEIGLDGASLWRQQGLATHSTWEGGVPAGPSPGVQAGCGIPPLFTCLSANCILSFFFVRRGGGHSMVSERSPECVHWY
jgi:hypothetical protein